nr:delta-60 repeat domain-containing protein [uncultured Desulfobulbus sp.]
MQSWLLSLMAALLALTCPFSSVFASTRLDSSFGLSGRVAIELGRRNGGHGLLVQPDGKVVIAGSSTGLQDGSLNFSVVRLDQNGSLDTTFNHEGSIVTSLVPGDDEALAVGRLSDGRIVAGGYSFNGRDRDFALACYLANGTLDYSFGTDGAVLTSIGNSHEEISALVVDPANRIVVAGTSEGTAGKIIVVARYLADGRLDRSFGEQGIALVGVGQDANAEGILLREDGSLVLSGSYVDQRHQAGMLVGLRADGLLNTDFGSQGVAGVPETFQVSEGYGVAEDRDGMLYLAGSIGKPGQREGALFRFTASGGFDFAFGENGARIVRKSTEDDVLYDVVAKNGSISAGGFTQLNGQSQMLLVSLAPVPQTSQDAVSIFDGAENAPIQEVRINGSTRVQIRKLQTWTGEMLLQHMELLQSLLKEPSAGLSQPATSSGTRFRSALTALLSPARAHAATSDVLPRTGGPADALEMQVMATEFGNDTVVCYALTSDMDGQVLAVGTAEDRGASSIVAARFVADDVIDRAVDRPGHRSSHITTLPSTDVSQNALTTGGEITDAFPKKIVRRGVLFSLKPGQAYRQNQVGLAKPSVETWLDRIGQIMLPSAMAADASQGTASDASATPLLEEGITDNGDGKGTFYARLEHLLPSSVYYIRAYAMTAGGEIYYGDQISVRTADACFIATASFGTLLHPCVQILRDFRDTYLAHSAWGHRVVHLYYSFSPPIAAVIAGSPGLRFAVRILLLPLIGFSWISLHLGLAAPLSIMIAITVVGVQRWRFLRQSGKGLHSDRTEKSQKSENLVL